MPQKIYYYLMLWMPFLTDVERSVANFDAMKYDAGGDEPKNETRKLPVIYQVWVNLYHTIDVANIVLSKQDVITGDEKAQWRQRKIFKGAPLFYPG